MPNLGGRNSYFATLHRTGKATLQQHVARQEHKLPNT